MAKKLIIGTVAVFVAWSVLDFVLHGVLLQKAYADTASLWRPMEEMKMGVMYTVTLIASVTFVFLYAKMVTKTGLNSGLLYGLLIGILWGVSFGYGTYSVMPIPYYMAMTWFFGTIVECTVAGALVGLLVKD
ncbi:MAG: hypothetical protein KDC45_14710 [Bacteroidetes bacterium]|nr:hypothetical protein [Bacteroidota bacterium]